MALERFIVFRIRSVTRRDRQFIRRELKGRNRWLFDTILAESGVAKMTLDKGFKSKDELILAVLVVDPASLLSPALDRGKHGRAGRPTDSGRASSGGG